MNRLLPLFLLFAFTSVGYTQVKYEKLYKPFEPIVIELDSKAPEGSKQTVIWNADFEYREAGGILFGWCPVGTYSFAGTVFNTRTVKLGDENLEVLVGAPTQVKGEFRVANPQPDPTPTPTPPPDPQPNPTPVPTPGNCAAVPGDGFNNLGQRVCQWCTGLPKRQELAQVYERAAYTLLNDPAATPNTVGNQILIDRTASLGVDIVQYKNFVDKLNAELQAHWPMQKADLAEFFQSTARGLKGG